MIQKTIQNLHNYIDGKWVPGESTFEARNPANDQVIAAVPESTPSDVHTAIQAARRVRGMATCQFGRARRQRPMKFELNRRTFVGASVAIGGVVATSSLLAGCSDDEASAASAAE